jgi:hypothetical protein
MPSLKEFLFNQDIGVESTGDGLHIAVSLAESLSSAAEMFDVVAVGSVAGVTLGVTGPILGMAGVFMALGSGYEEAREEIQNEAVANGFSQGFVAGLLNMSGSTVKFLFGQHAPVPRHPGDPDADVLEMHAYNRGLVAGYAMAKQVPDDDKKAYLSEIRQFTGHVDAGNWTDRDKINYVIEYAAKLRLNFLQ